MNKKNNHANLFGFTQATYDHVTGKAILSYHMDGRVMEEQIIFPAAPWPLDAEHQAVFYRALELLHLIAGVSYYKAGLAQRIDVTASTIDPAMAGFLNELYIQGLGEFAFCNQLDMRSLINFRANTESAPTALQLDMPERALVAMGGGKDSLVCLEALRNAGMETQPICVGNSFLIGETARVAGLPLLRIQRTLSPVLVELNAAGAWNGHVPVTAINSAILLCAAILYDYRYVVFANESSASEATLTDGQGHEINHQYSKSLAFEQIFRKIIRQRVSHNVEYFSLLRAYGEIAIARQFAQMRKYHDVFSSCNRNFHQGGSRIESRWCQDCPKCRFTALILALFISPRQLINIQGADLLNQQNQLRGFKELCGLGVDKPFECVGSIAESRSAMKQLTTYSQWQGKLVVKALAAEEEIKQAAAPEFAADVDAEHYIPATIQAKLNAV